MLITLDNLRRKIKEARDACSKLDTALNSIHKDRCNPNRFPSVDKKIGEIYEHLRQAHDKMDAYRAEYVAEGEIEQESEAA